MKPGLVKWTKEEVQRAVAFRERGYSFPRIAELMSRSCSSVRAKVQQESYKKVTGNTHKVTCIGLLCQDKPKAERTFNSPSKTKRLCVKCSRYANENQSNMDI